jgi:hypothetical protein
MTKRGSSSSAVRREAAEPTRSLEERLHAVRQGCRLLTDVFDLLAQAAVLDAPFRMSGQGCNVLADLCRTFADDLDELLKGIPGDVANWTEIPDPSGVIVGGSLRHPPVHGRAQAGSRPRQRRAQRAKS